MTTQNTHTFHIPVMGLAYTVDSPIRVAQFGISSVVSITDDEVIEKILPHKSDEEFVKEIKQNTDPSKINPNENENYISIST